MNTIYLNNSATYPGFITFSNIPPPSLIGNKNQYPFSISLSAVDAGEHYIDLYSFNSRSSPYQTPQNKWSHLVPQWRFTDLDGNVINNIKTTDTLLSSGNTFIGVSGYAEFYYIDDLSTVDDTPVLIWATMQVSGVPNIDDTTIGKHTFPSFVNSKVATVCPYFVNPLTPSKLSITRNGIDEMSTSSYWVSTNIGNVITIEGEYSGGDCGGNSVSSTIMYDYPSSNAHGFSMGAIEKSIITMPMSSQAWVDIDTGSNTDYFQTYDDKGFRIGGYVRNTVYPYNTSLAATITAGVSATFVVPETENPFIWISHPNAGQIYKINYPNTPSTFVDYVTAFIPNLAAYQKVSYPTPIITEISDYNPLTGFGGIYSMAVDSCFNVWAADSEQDKLFKFSSSGQLLSTINFNGLRRQKIFSNNWTGVWNSYGTMTLNSSWAFYCAASSISTPIDTKEISSYVFDITINPQKGFGYYKYLEIVPEGCPSVYVGRNVVFPSLTSFSVHRDRSSTSSGFYYSRRLKPSLNYEVDYSHTTVDQASSLPLLVDIDVYTSFKNPTVAGISLDNDNNVWCSFFNDNAVIKLDGNTGEILTDTIFNRISSFTDYLETRTRTTIAECDLDNNAWVSRSYNLSSALAKVSTNGLILTSINLPNNSEPMDIVIDPDNNAWVTLTEQSGPPYLSGGVWCFNTNGTRISAFDAVHPSYMTIDVDSNIWYISDLNKVTKISRSTGQQTHMVLGSAVIPTWFYTYLYTNVYDALVAAPNTSENTIYGEGILSLVKDEVPDTIAYIYKDIIVDTRKEYVVSFWTKCTTPIAASNLVFFWGSIDTNCSIATDKWLYNEFLISAEVGGAAGVTKTIALEMRLSDYACTYEVRDFTIRERGVLSEYNFLEGIACDTFNRIWVIDSYENNVYLLSGGVVNDVINIYDAKNVWYNDNGIYSLSGEWEKSLQAFGDWSGIRRIMKYSPNSLNSQVCSVYLTGQSAEFSIDSFDNYYIRRPNESWDVTTQMRNYALPTHIYENPNLFLGYIDAMVGTLENGKISLGRMSYEKIANFGRNVVDIDVSNIDQLYSLAESMDVYISDYKFSYPYDIKRLIDIGSVSHSKLWGTRCKCNMHFGIHRICEVCGHEHPINRGSQIDTTTYSVTAGVPVLAMHNYTPNKFDILEPVVNNQTIEQSLSGKLLNSVAEYKFFNYDQTPCGIQVAGIINWEDEYTTLSESSSALEEWYGSGKLLEKMFNYHLYKGCGI